MKSPPQFHISLSAFPPSLPEATTVLNCHYSACYHPGTCYVERHGWVPSYMVLWTAFFFFFFFLSFYGCTCGIRKFLGEGSIRSCGCQPIPQPWQHQIWGTSVTFAAACSNARSLTHWARPGIKPASSQTLCWVLNPLSHNENSLRQFSNPFSCAYGQGFL